MIEDVPYDKGGGNLKAGDLAIEVIAPGMLPSPVLAHLGEHGGHFVSGTDKVLVDDALSRVTCAAREQAEVPAFEQRDDGGLPDRSRRRGTGVPGGP